jgi:hypothetical protein
MALLHSARIGAPTLEVLPDFIISAGPSVIAETVL